MFPESIRLAHYGCAAGLLVSFLAGLIALERKSDAAPLQASEGQVVSVDRYGLILADPRDGKERVFSVNQSTKIMRNGNLARLTDVRPGDLARITIRPLGDKLIALTVTAEGRP
jgi:hypothetical protein